MFKNLEKIYKGKKVLVTGHTGFKGAWLIKMLNMLGAQIRGYALLPEGEHNLYTTLSCDGLCESIIGDLRDKNKLNAAIHDFQPDFVFHLAAQPLVRLSYQIPAETFEVNAIGTANVLDGIILLQKACNVILITTDKVYYNYEWVYPYRENDRLGGYDPYSASKACAELIIDSYRNSFFNLKKYSSHQKAIAVARAGNVIGGGDWAIDRLVPDIIRALIKKEKIEIRNPSAVRPWQHVLEPLTGYLMLGARLMDEPEKYSKAYNFGPELNDALSVEKIVALAIDSWGQGDYYVNMDKNPLHEAGLLKLDISLAAEEIGWHPKFNAVKALNSTIDWYKNYFDDIGTVQSLTEKQIINFLN